MLPLLLKGMFGPLPVPARFTKSFPRGMSVRPGQIRAESQDGVAMIPVALAMRHRYQELSMPIVIMAGTKDRVVKDSQAVRLHEQIQHSVLRLIPGVGHMVHYAVPDQVARAKFKGYENWQVISRGDPRESRDDRGLPGRGYRQRQTVP